MSNTHNEEAVKALLKEFDKEVITASLEDFWESWLTNERNDCTSTEVRTNRWFVYQELLKLVNAIT